MRTVKEFLKDSAKYIIIIIVVLLIVTYIVSLQQVVGPSMTPNYVDGDILILNKLYYHLKKPKRFEVVAIKYDDSKYFIKRVIGLPGEHVAYKDGILYIDGVEVNEKFNKVDSIDDFDLKKLGYDVIPDDYYFVVGDNRTDSLDSRYKEVGLINKKDFIGKIVIRIWPFRK